jgi:hypothetical protein
MKENLLNSRKLIISGISLAFSLMIITGCSNSNPVGTNSDGTVVSSDSSTDTTFAQAEPNGLKFSKVSEKNAALLANQQGNQQANTNQGSGGATGDSLGKSVQGIAAPTAVAAPRDAAVSPESAIKFSGPIYGGYFPAPGPFEEYVMVDYQEAKSEGFTGTYLDTYNKKVKPLIAAWSADARHTSSNGSTDDAGLNKSTGNTTDPNQPNYYNPYQWQFTFASASKKEVYSIFVSSTETLVLRQKWAIKNLNLADIKIDSNAAIKIYTDIIADKGAKSPDNQDQYQYTPQPNSEVLYSIPEKGSWYFYLNQEKEGLVWNINLNFNNYYDGGGRPIPLTMTDTPVVTPPPKEPSVLPSFSPPQPVERTYYSGGYARINAKTGEVISFNRPMKYTEKYYPYPTPYVKCDEQGNCYGEGGVTTGGTSGASSGGTAPASVIVDDAYPNKQVVPY